MGAYYRFSFEPEKPRKRQRPRWLSEVASVVVIAVAGALLHWMGII